METCNNCKKELRYDFEKTDGICEECVINTEVIIQKEKDVKDDDKDI